MPSGPHATPGPARRPVPVQNPAVPQSSLPQVIPPYSLPLMEKQQDGTVLNDPTWYLYLYNLSRQVLPIGGNPPVITQVILQQVPPSAVFFSEGSEDTVEPIVGLPAAIGGSGATVGTAIVDFGAGALDTSVAVTGQGGVLTTSILNAWANGKATANNLNDAIFAEDMQFFASDIVPGVGFTVYAFCRFGRAYGKYNVNWSWQ